MDGWRCPGCGRAWAPHVDSCRACEPGAPSVPKDVVRDAPLTTGKLWEQWEPWGEENIASWRICKTHKSAFKRTKIRMPDGREVTMFDLPWSDCTPQAAEIYRSVRQKTSNGRGGVVSPITVDRELASLQSMFGYFQKLLRTISHNPIDGFRRNNPDEYARKTSLTPEQVRQFIEAGPPMFQDVCWVAYRAAGMRHSEARLLKKSEIDWDSRVINLPSKRNKNRRARVIPFPEDVAEILERHSKNSRGPYVFVNPRDPRRIEPVSPGSMQQWLTKARERSGVKGFDGESIVIHTLRHSGVTQLVTDGAQESHIKRAAGMSDKTFRRYSQFNRPQQENLRAVMNRQVEPPTPLVSVKGGERLDPKRTESAPVDEKPAARKV